MNPYYFPVPPFWRGVFGVFRAPVYDPDRGGAEQDAGALADDWAAVMEDCAAAGLAVSPPPSPIRRECSP